MVEPKEVKSVLAQNLTAYRKQNNLTQSELAEKLNYSDKAVSKWERAESVPDIAVLKQIADLYSITLDDLTTEKEDNTKHKKNSGFEKIESLLKTERLIIPFLAAGLVWFIATINYVFLAIFEVSPLSWLTFIYAVPVSLIVLLVFNAIWGNKILSAVIISFLIWSLPLCVVLTFTFSDEWLVFLIPAPMQVLVVLWYIMRVRSKKEK